MALLVGACAALGGLAPGAYAAESWVGNGEPAQGGLIRNIRTFGTSPDTTLYAAVFGSGVYKASSNGGASWTAVNTGLTNKFVNTIRNVSGNHSNTTLYVGTNGGGVFRSSTGTINWTEFNTGLNCRYVRNLDVVNANVIYAMTDCGVNSGVYRSSGPNAPWVQLNTGNGMPASVRVISMTVSNSGLNLRVATDGSGVYFSNDAGSSWTQINGAAGANPLPGLNTSSISVVTGGAGGDLAVLVEGYGVYRTADNGTNWSASTTGLPSLATQGGFSNFSGFSTYYLSVPGFGLYGATGANAPWDPVTGSDHLALPYSRGIFQSTTGTPYYAATLAGIYKSAAGSLTGWTPIKNGLPGGDTVTSATDPTNANIIYVAADTIYKTVDGGANWVRSDTGFIGPARNVRLDYTNPSLIYATSDHHGVYRSTNAGATWVQSNGGLSSTTISQVTRIWINRITPSTLYVSQEGGGVYRSLDSGASWTNISSNLTGKGLDVRRVRNDPTNSNILYAATGEGLYKSVNGGGNWSLVFQQVSPASITQSVGDITFDHVNPSTVFIGTNNSDALGTPFSFSGVWKTTNGGTSWTQVLSSHLSSNVAAVGGGTEPLIVYAGSHNSTGGGVLRSLDGGANWSAFNTGLANNLVHSFEADSTRTRVLRVNTYGGTYALTNGVDAALAGVAAGLDAFKAIINAHTAGNDLDYTHLLSAYDANFLAGGLDRTKDTKITASDLRGGSITSFTITKVNSYDDVNGIINVAVMITGTSLEGPFTEVIEDGQTIFKRQGDGTYKLYGDQRIARISIQVSMQTDYGPGSPQGPRQHVNFDVEAPEGTLSTATNAHSVPSSTPNNWTGAGQLPLNLTIGSNRTESIQGSPGVPEDIINNAFFGGFDPATPITSGTVFQVNLTKADTTPVPYNVPVVGTLVTNTSTDAITNMTVNGTTATSFPASVLSSPINVGWTLPTGYAIQNVRLSSHAHVTTNDTCPGSQQDLGATAILGQVTVPSTCPSGTVNNVGISVQTEGFNGERSQFNYHFDIAAAAPPPAPTGVTATPFADGSIQMNWNAVSGAASYNIYMATVTGVTKTNYLSLGGHSHTGITATTYTHPAGAATGTTYYLVVTALNAQGESVESAQISTTIPAANAPAVTLSTSSLNFGSQTVSVPSANLSVTITNSGTATLNIASIDSSSGIEWAIVGNTCGTTLAVSANCQVTLSFVPQATGARNGSLTITSDATVSPHSVTLSGTGAVAAPAVGLSTSSINFGNVTVGQPSVSQSVTVTNTGGGTLSISAAGISGAGFANSGNTCSGANLAASQSCTVTGITLTPPGTGPRSGAVTITSNATGSPHTVTLTGTGVLAIGGTPTLWTRFGGSDVSNSIRQGQTANYKAVLVKGDGAIVDPVTPAWSITSGPATVDNGVVTAGAVSVDTPATLVASFTDAVLTGGATVTNTRNLTIQASGDHWTGGGDAPGQGGDVRSFVTVGTEILAAVYGGGLRRTSDGVTWVQSGYGIPFRNSAFVRSLRTVPGTTTHILAAVQGRGIYRSSNGGVTWTPSNSGMGCNFPRGFAARNSTNTLYVASDCGVYKSIDSGNTWTSTSVTEPVRSIVAFGGSNTVWAVTLNSGLYRSPDAGATWSAANGDLPNSQVYSFDSRSGVTLAMVEGAGIFRTSDNGASWVSQNSGLPTSYGFQGGIGYQVSDGHFYVSVEGNGLYRGTTGSNSSAPVSWLPWGNTLSQLPMSARTPLYDSNSDSYYVATGQGVFSSMNSGASWTKVSTGLSGGFTRGTATDPADTNVVYATADTVYKSTDGGVNWAKADNGITVAISSNRGSGGTILRRDDGALYVSTGNGGIFKSVNNAGTWTPVNDGLPAILGQGVTVRGGLVSAPQTLYALFGEDALGVYKTVDGGANWVSITGDLPAGNARLTNTIVTDPATGALYLGTEAGLYKSVNGGTNWTSVYAANPVATVRVDDGVSPSNVYFSTYVNDNFNVPLTASGLYRSAAGAAPTQLLSGYLVQNFRAPRPGGQLTLYLSSWNNVEAQAGVFKSIDGGTNWQTINSGLNHRYVGSFDVVNDQLMHAATRGGGVFTYVPGSSPTVGVPLTLGFNLIGNTRNTPINVASVFGNQDTVVPGVTDKIFTIWKWNSAGNRWAFYSPRKSVADNASFVVGKYDLLTTINPGEGFWVNAEVAMTLQVPAGADFNWNGSTFGSLPTGFQLIAHAQTTTPSAFNVTMNFAPPETNVIPTGNFLTLWAWNAVVARWYFYAPQKEEDGGLAEVRTYALSRNFLHFEDDSKKLGHGVGFWVNRP